MRAFKYGGSALLLAAAFGAFSAVSAQSAKATPKPLATPPRVLTGAEIISRADDLLNPSVVLPQENTEVKPTSEAAEIAELLDRIKKLEAGRTAGAGTKKADPDEVQK